MPAKYHWRTASVSLFLTLSPCSPRSVDDHKVPCVVGISAYRCSGLLGAAASVMRPVSPLGKPSVSFFQVSPPSVERHTPPVALPLIMVQGLRCAVHMPANSTCGLPGSITRVEAPVLSSTYSTFCQVLPASVVLNTPRSGFGPQGLPCAATHTLAGFSGSITIAEIWPASFSPMNCQVLPASGE